MAAHALYSEIVLSTRKAKNIVAVGARSKPSSVEVCFASELEPTSLGWHDRHRNVNIALSGESFVISPCHSWQQDQHEIVCDSKDSLFLELEILAVKARYNKF